MRREGIVHRPVDILGCNECLQAPNVANRSKDGIQGREGRVGRVDETLYRGDLRHQLHERPCLPPQQICGLESSRRLERDRIPGMQLTPAKTCVWDDCEGMKKTHGLGLLLVGGEMKTTRTPPSSSVEDEDAASSSSFRRFLAA